MALVAPRLTLFLVVLFSDYVGQAYESNFWPFLGFFFFPVTTLAYAWSIHSNGAVNGGWTLVVVLAVLIDLGILGGGGHSVWRGKKGAASRA